MCFLLFSVSEPAELNFSGMKKKKKKPVRFRTLRWAWSCNWTLQMNWRLTFIHPAKSLRWILIRLLLTLEMGTMPKVRFPCYWFKPCSCWTLLRYLSPRSLDDQAVDEEQGEGIVLGGGPRYPWDGTDRDYKYEEVLKYISAIPSSVH
jgi:hypothetical protein